LTTQPPFFGPARWQIPGWSSIGKSCLDWDFEDPTGKGLPEVLAIRDKIASRVDTPASEFEGSPDL